MAKVLVINGFLLRQESACPVIVIQGYEGGGGGKLITKEEMMFSALLFCVRGQNLA